MRRAVLLVLVAVMACVGALGLRWRAQYQPLVIEREAVNLGDRVTGVEHPGGALLATTSHSGDFESVASDDPADERELVRTNYVDGERLTYAVAIRNTGSVGVVVTGFDVLGPKEFGLLGVTSIRVGKRLPTGTSAEHTTSFRSFTLRAGETRDVVFRVLMHACEYNVPGSRAIEEGVSVRYRVLGLSRRIVLQTPMRIEIESPKEEACPRQRAG